MAENKEIQQAWSDFVAFFHKHKNALQELSPNQPAPPTKPGNVFLPGTTIPAGGSLPPAGTAFPGFTLPDPDGLVQLTDNVAWAGKRVQVAEITNSQTGDAHAKALANLNRANEIYNISTSQHTILACYEATVNASGNGVLDISKPIMGSTNFPAGIAPDDTTNLGTASGVLAWCAKTKPAGPNPDAQPFPHPPGNPNRDNKPNRNKR